MHSVPSHRIVVLARRYPPDGATDFGLVGLVRRDLDLLSSIAQPPSALQPSVGHDGTAPRRWLFDAARCSHVAIVAGAIDGQLVDATVELFSADGTRQPWRRRGDLSAAGDLARQLALDIVSAVGLTVGGPDAQRLAAAAISPGPAFTQWIRYWYGIYGGAGVDADAELHAAAAGYPNAWRYIAGWDATASQIHGYEPALEEQLALVRRAAEGDPLHVAAQVDLADLLAEAGRFEEGMAVVDRAQSFAPQSAGLWLARAGLLDRVDRRDESFAAAERAWALAPFDARTILSRSSVMYVRNERAERIRLLQDAVRVRSDDIYLRLLLAGALLDERKFGEALAAYRAALAAVDRTPWHDLPYKVPHLDYHDSTRWAISWPLALAAAGAGEDPRPFLQMHVDLQPDPAAYLGALGGMDALVGAVTMQTRFEDPTVRAAAAAPPDGGVRDLERYAQLAFEVERAQAAGAELDAVLARLGLDTGRWLKAQRFWSDRLSSDDGIALRYVEARAAAQRSAGPMPAYPKARAAAPAATPGAAGNGGVDTIEDWGRVSAVLQKAMGQGKDFMTALAACGLDMASYQAASAYWSAKMQEDLSLGAKMMEAMARYL